MLIPRLYTIHDININLQLIRGSLVPNCGVEIIE